MRIEHRKREYETIGLVFAHDDLRRANHCAPQISDVRLNDANQYISPAHPWLAQEHPTDGAHRIAVYPTSTIDSESIKKTHESRSLCRHTGDMGGWRLMLRDNQA